MKQQNKIHVKHPLELAANMRVIYTFYFNSILRISSLVDFNRSLGVVGCSTRVILTIQKWLSSTARRRCFCKTILDY
jgi:hypothetical protein